MFVPMKKVLACSAALTGGYVYMHPQNWVHFGMKRDEKSAVCNEVSSYIHLPESSGNNFEEYDYTFERKSNLPLYWKLLKLCKSKDHKIQQKAIKSLSKMSLENWEYIMIAQACDAQISISLARHFDTSPYFFLSPPFRDLNEGNVQNELFNLLLYLPPSNDVYIENLRRLVVKNAKSFLKNVEYSLDLEVGDPSVLFHSQQKKRLVYLFDERILQIFLSYSATSYYRKLMIEKGILKLLHKVLRSHNKEPNIQSLIGQILANFALEAKFTKAIFMAGWIGILASWAKSSDIIVNLPAAKALANLDKDDVFSSLYDDGVYILNPVFRQSQKEPIADVIFVHGLRGRTFWTWRQCDTQKKALNFEGNDESKEKSYNLNKNFHSYSMCWPKDWLSVDIPLLRLISVDYKASISTWSSKSLEEKEKDNISKNSRELINKLLLSNIGERPIFWITHSMGGLIVKQILVEAFESEEKKLQMLARKTCGIVFYSVPHKGSELAKKISSASRILLPSTDFTQLEKGSPRLLTLHEKFKNVVLNYHIPILSFGESKKTHWGLTSSVPVSLDSADPGIGEFYVLPVNHLSVCKPVSPSSFDYKKVLQFLNDSLSKIISHDGYSPSLQRKMFEISKVLCLIP